MDNYMNLHLIWLMNLMLCLDVWDMLDFNALLIYAL